MNQTCTVCGIRPRSIRGGHLRFNCDQCNTAYLRERRASEMLSESEMLAQHPPGWKACRCCGERLYWVEDWTVEATMSAKKARWFCGPACLDRWIDDSIDLEAIASVLKK